MKTWRFKFTFFDESTMTAYIEIPSSVLENSQAWLTVIAKHFDLELINKTKSIEFLEANYGKKV